MECEFIGGPVHGQRLEVDAIATVSLHVELEHFYKPWHRGDEVVFVHDGPHHQCPGCWKTPIAPNELDEVICTGCDRVYNVKCCRRCRRVMEPELFERTIRSKTLGGIGQTHDLAYSDPARVIWQCSCDAGGVYHARVAERCPRCGYEGARMAVMGLDSKWLCAGCRLTYVFGLPHHDETPAHFDMTDLVSYRPQRSSS